MRWKRNSEPVDNRPYRVRIADWIEQTDCDPTHPDAPNFRTLDGMQREGLLREVFDGTEHLTWKITPLGEYEIKRQRAGGEPPWNGIV